jgi:hypothetical protein
LAKHGLTILERFSVLKDDLKDVRRPCITPNKAFKAEVSDAAVMQANEMLHPEFWIGQNAPPKTS